MSRPPFTPLWTPLRPGVVGFPVGDRSRAVAPPNPAPAVVSQGGGEEYLTAHGLDPDEFLNWLNER